MLLLLTSCVFELKDGTYIWSDLTIDGVLADENNASFVDNCNFYISVMEVSDNKFNLSFDEQNDIAIMDGTQVFVDGNNLMFPDLKYSVYYDECLLDVSQKDSGIITSRKSFSIESILFFSELNNKCYEYLIPCDIHASVDAEFINE